jgi:DMSO/TMAO reductase YedYZ molybdopterin-dependent catalytic subunit
MPAHWLDPVSWTSSSAWILWKTAKNAVSPTGSSPVASVNHRKKDHEHRSTQRHHPLNRIKPKAFGRSSQWAAHVVLTNDTNGAPPSFAHGAPVRLRNETQLEFKQVKLIKGVEFAADSATATAATIRTMSSSATGNRSNPGTP